MDEKRYSILVDEYKCKVLKVDAINRNGDFIARANIEKEIEKFKEDNTNVDACNEIGKIFLSNTKDKRNNDYLIGYVDDIYIDLDDFMVVEFHTIDTPMTNVFHQLLKCGTPLGLGMCAHYTQNLNMTNVYSIKSFVAYPLTNVNDVKAGLAMTKLEFPNEDKIEEEMYDVVDETKDEEREDDKMEMIDTKDAVFGDGGCVGNLYECDENPYKSEGEEADYYYDFMVAPYALIDVCETLHWNGIYDACITKEDGDLHIRWKRDLRRHNKN